MSEFKREDRYLVLKRRDLEKLHVNLLGQLDDWIARVGPDLPQRQYVIVESDWPEYEVVFKMIEDRVTGSQVTTDNSQTLVNALVEIERLNDRLLMVEAILAGNGALITGLKADLERKDAALRVALEALALANGFILEDGDLDHAIETVQEAL